MLPRRSWARLRCGEIFRNRLQGRDPGPGVLVYSRAGYGNSTPAGLPRPLDYMHIEALEILPQLLEEIGFSPAASCSGIPTGASIAAIYAGGVQDHRIRGVADDRSPFRRGRYFGEVDPPRSSKPMRPPISDRS